MAKRKKQPAISTVSQSLELGDGLDKLTDMLAKKAASTGSFSACRMSNDYLTWRYADFWDPKLDRPCLPLEWFFGTRGLINGRVLNITGDGHAGKTSFLTLLMAGAFKKHGAYLIYVETEESPLPADRVADLGISPSKIIKVIPAGVIECLQEIENTIFMIRRSLDPEKKYPILIGIDSISGLGNTGIDPETGEITSGDGSAGLHARKFSDFFRNKLKIFRAHNAQLIATSQIKTDIPMAGTFQRAGETHIAEGTFKYHSSWQIKLKKTKDPDTIRDAEPRGMVIMTGSKNKLSGGAQRKILNAYLYETARGWDFTKANLDLFNGIYSPFDPGDYKSGGGWYSHVAIKDGKNLRGEDFVNEFYANEEMVMKARENLCIRGFGFDFEATAPVELGPEGEDHAD